MTTVHFHRYRTPIADLFEEKKYLEFQLHVERALARANAVQGVISTEAANEIDKFVRPENVSLERVKEIENETHHDLFSMVLAATEACPNFGEHIHIGATSSDIKDTVLALQLCEAKKILLNNIDAVLEKLKELTIKYRDLVCIGRTHGQHAIPITFGFKFANFLSELYIAKTNFIHAKIDYGKMSGAVGTYAAQETLEIEKEVMQILKLDTLPITTQIIPRMIYFHFFSSLMEVVGVLEKIAKEIRNLQRTEIDEVLEPFGSKQVGSSAMPQKKNPWRSERICGISRALRQQFTALHENIALEHERDMTHSSTERIIIPQIITLTDFILIDTFKILDGLKINEEKVNQNLYLLDGKQCAENLLKHLTKTIGRQEAHSIIRTLSFEENFRKAVKNHPRIRSILSDEQIEEILNPQNYTGLISSVIDRVLNHIEK